jgi:selenocysteine-specific elongation factor
MTIDLGFAWTILGSGQRVGFVDVPGHIRFLRNMLAGVAAVDACLFVVDVLEGWKPQSEEHLRILQLLGHSKGVVALTKVAGQDDELIELARLDVRDHLAGTFLAEAPICPVDSISGEGLDDLRGQLDAVLQRPTGRPDSVQSDRMRLFIDRAFSARGSGTVVTGTLTGAGLALGDTASLFGPGHPSHGREVRVRALQTHREKIDRADPGQRVAANLVGVEVGQCQRGDSLVRPSDWLPSNRMDVSLSILGTLRAPVGRRGAYQVYLGSAEVGAQVRLIQALELPPGHSGVARLHLARPLTVGPGDRYILRESGRGVTIGGGEILEIEPHMPLSRARPDRSVDRIVAERGVLEVKTLFQLTGCAVPANLGQRWVASAEYLQRARADLTQRVAAAGPLGLEAGHLSEREREIVASTPELSVSGGRVVPAGSVDPLQQLAGSPYVKMLEEGLFQPPDPALAGIDRSDLRELVRLNLVISADGLYFHPQAIQEAGVRAAQLLSRQPDGFTASDFRLLLGTTRKYAMPILAELDRRGLTRRKGDLRVAGPRLAPPEVPD